MNWVMYFLGVGMMLFSFMVLAAAKGGIHEVYFAVLFGSGAICIGLGAVIQNLQALHPAVKAYERAQPVASLNPSAEPGQIVKTYRGVDILRTAKGYRVGQKDFDDLIAAEYHIDLR